MGYKAGFDALEIYKGGRWQPIGDPSRHSAELHPLSVDPSPSRSPHFAARSAHPQGMTGARLAAIALVVPDYDPAIAFFCSLGFRWPKIFPRPAPMAARNAGSPSNRPAAARVLVLARAETPEQMAAVGKQGGGRVHLFSADR